MSASEALLERTYTRDEKIAFVLAVIDQGIPVGAIAQHLFASQENQRKFKQMLNNWVNSYNKAVDENREPFMGRGRRTASYSLSQDQAEVLNKIAEILNR